MEEDHGDHRLAALSLEGSTPCCSHPQEVAEAGLRYTVALLAKQATGVAV